MVKLIVSEFDEEDTLPPEEIFGAHMRTSLARLGAPSFCCFFRNATDKKFNRVEVGRP